jgi:NAD(P)H dehydrogenase (quinone)
VKVLIVFASSTGRTQRLAEAAAEGARQAGAEVRVLRCEDAQAADVLETDALLLASAVHMAGVTSGMRAFFERLSPLWLQGRLVGKVGAAMVSAGQGGRGGGELALVSLLANLAEHGMLIVPMHNRLAGFSRGGSHWGALARTNPGGGSPPGPTDEHLEAARSHGLWLAECTARWLRGLRGRS